ncbi:MAG: electron transporter RnfC, partial [Bacteroidaceae bacterium]|nr:electron transporter RnfC [Bacteroidaceae bacterium]
MKTFRIGGVHPAENKLSAGKAIETLALPKQAVFPLSQHIGAPATA